MTQLLDAQVAETFSSGSVTVAGAFTRNRRVIENLNVPKYRVSLAVGADSWETAQGN
jgi:hypothetical protein